VNLPASPEKRRQRHVAHRVQLDTDSASPVPHAPVVHLPLELLAGQARADFLLERQPADARILDAIDADGVHTLADARERDRQRIRVSFVVVTKRSEEGKRMIADDVRSGGETRTNASDHTSALTGECQP